jgi:hypothetical protein
MSGSPRPLGSLILIIVAVLVAMAVFWVGFMLAPAAVLLIFYLALSAGERGRHQRREIEQESGPLAIPPGSSELRAAGGSSEPGSSQPGRQLGTRRAGERPPRRASHPIVTESELVETGSASNQPKGARP